MDGTVTRRTTDLQIGDCFVVHGLSGQDLIDQVVVVLDDMSLTGTLTFYVIVDGKKRQNKASMGLCEVMEMIRQGAWDYLGKREHVFDEDTLKKVR